MPNSAALLQFSEKSVGTSIFIYGNTDLVLKIYLLKIIDIYRSSTSMATQNSPLIYGYYAVFGHLSVVLQIAQLLKKQPETYICAS